MDSKTIAAAPTGAQLAAADSESVSIRNESPVAHGPWTRDIEALCRALDAQQRAHFPGVDRKEK
jgi:hypothetical protein